MNKEYFLSINDVSKRLDLPAYTLRYWEKQFPVKVKPTTGAGGRRYYRPETVTALETIKDLLYSRGMTIAGVKKMIKEGNFEELEINSPASESKVANLKPEVSMGLFSNSDDLDTALDLLKRAKAELK